MPGAAPDDEATGITLTTVPRRQIRRAAPGFRAAATVMIACGDRCIRTSARGAAAARRRNVTCEGEHEPMSTNSTQTTGSARRRSARRRSMTADAGAGGDVR
jgi:hypothetical protein